MQVDIKPTIIILAKSTAKYVHSRILIGSERDAYRTAMKMCLDILLSNIENFDMLKAQISGLHDEAYHQFKPTRFSSKRREIEFFQLAITHTLDIINTLEMRFLTGGNDPGPRGIRPLYVYDVDDTFE